MTKPGPLSTLKKKKEKEQDDDYLLLLKSCLSPRPALWEKEEKSVFKGVFSV